MDCLFPGQVHNYVVERRHLHSDDPVILWRIEAGRLLHKFLPELQIDGNIVHKPSAVVRSFLTCYIGSHEARKLVEFMKGIFQTWKVMKNDCGRGKSLNSTNRSWNFSTEDNHFRNLNIKLKRIKITISKTNVCILAFQFTYLLFYLMFLILVTT